MASSSSDLELEVEVDKQRIKTGCLSTTNFELPEELPSVEEALKDLVAAMNALKTPGLSKTEIRRLRCLIQTSSLYQKRIAEYMDYRGTEKWLIDLEEKYDGVAKGKKNRWWRHRREGRVSRSRTAQQAFFFF